MHQEPTFIPLHSFRTYALTDDGALTATTSTTKRPVKLCRRLSSLKLAAFDLGAGANVNYNESGCFEQKNALKTCDFLANKQK